MRKMILPLVATLTIYMLAGCGTEEIEPEKKVNKEVKEDVTKVEETKIKKE